MEETENKVGNPKYCTDYWRCDGCNNIVVSGSNSCRLRKCEIDSGKPYTGLFLWREHMYGMQRPHHTKEDALEW